MRFVKTLLGALALCAGLLIWAGYVIGSGPPIAGTVPRGLTAAAVLASDGMAPDGRPGDLDRGALGRLTRALSAADAPGAAKPAG
ncbi:hypothetical protein [Methylobacterium sp. CM6257]|jgi:hypothetical protein